MQVEEGATKDDPEAPGLGEAIEEDEEEDNEEGNDYVENYFDNGEEDISDDGGDDGGKRISVMAIIIIESLQMVLRFNFTKTIKV